VQGGRRKREKREREKKERKKEEKIARPNFFILSSFRNEFPPFNINFNSKSTQGRGKEGYSLGKIEILVVMCGVFYIGIEYGIKLMSLISIGFD